MLRKFWRRVWVWDLDSKRWNVVTDETVQAFDPFQCVFDGPSWCVQPQPYVYEQWWSYTQSTIGTGSGGWNYLGGRVNYGTNPVVN